MRQILDVVPPVLRDVQHLPRLQRGLQRRRLAEAREAALVWPVKIDLRARAGRRRTEVLESIMVKWRLFQVAMAMLGLVGPGGLYIER